MSDRKLTSTHTQKALLTFTREELRALITGLDHVRGYIGTPTEGEAIDALRARLVFAADSLP